MNEQKNPSAISVFLKSIKDSISWVMGGDPYRGKTVIDLDPSNDKDLAPNVSPINWTRIIIFLIGFATLTLWIYPFISRFVKSLPNKLRK